MRGLGAGRDHFSDMLAAVFTPVPHEERMRAVVSIATPVHLDVARIVCKLTLVLLAQRESIASLWQQTIKELDIARMKIVIELVEAGMMHDHHAAFFQQRFVAIK